MIEFKVPRLRGVNCNICHKSNDVVEITFRSDLSNSGHTVAICHDCRKTLAHLLIDAERAGEGNGIASNQEPVVHCRECEQWDTETEQSNSLPRQCECKMFSNSSVSHYTNENGFCYRGTKRETTTVGNWLRGLPDEKLVKYLDWGFLCQNSEKCSEESSCERCAIKRLKQEYTGEGDGWGE